MNLNHLLKRLREKTNAFEFAAVVKSVLETPPLDAGHRDFVLLSMVQSRDVLPYLLAAKSFASYASPSKAVVVADPSLTRDDRAVLRKHIPFLEIVDAGSLQVATLPKGGTWERLIKIASLAPHHYVVQLDADTLTVAPIEEVVRAIEENRSFVLATANGQQIRDVQDAIEGLAGARESNAHIQALAEANLDALVPLGDFRYVRGCSGFAGFARGSLEHGTLVSVSQAMHGRTGARWSEWGTEQVTSNIVTSSAQNAVLLPHPKYCAPHWRDEYSAFLHFIGYVRYANRYYATVARKAIARLHRTEGAMAP